MISMILYITGKSLSEALLFVELGENMLCAEIVSDIQNNFCTQVHNMFSPCSTKRRASDKDLHVLYKLGKKKTTFIKHAL